MALVQAGQALATDGKELAEYLKSDHSNDHNGSEYQQADYRKEEERVELSFFINMERVSNVDLVTQTFDAQFDLELIWRATENDDRRHEADPEHYRPSFVPVIKFPNGDIEHLQLKETGTFYDGRLTETSHCVYNVDYTQRWS